MSRVNRIVLAVLVSLAVIVGIYTTVEGASLSASRERSGVHIVSGSLANLDHFRTANTASTEFQPEFLADNGHGCKSESYTSPDD